jgi:hypothetical protein
MAQGKRDRLSTEQRIDMWRRWKAGESLHEIGRAFGKGHGSIRFLLTQRGGIVPAARRRSPRTLTLAEREDISRGIASGSSIREIARVPSVSHEQILANIVDLQQLSLESHRDSHLFPTRVITSPVAFTTLQIASASFTQWGDVADGIEDRLPTLRGCLK